MRSAASFKMGRYLRVSAVPWRRAVGPPKLSAASQTPEALRIGTASDESPDSSSSSTIAWPYARTCPTTWSRRLGVVTVRGV